MLILALALMQSQADMETVLRRPIPQNAPAQASTGLPQASHAELEGLCIQYLAATNPELRKSLGRSLRARAVSYQGDRSLFLSKCSGAMQ